MIMRRFVPCYVFFTITALCWGLCGTADAGEKIIWPYICFYPMYICENDKNIGGIGWEILQHIWKNMPEYENEAVLLPIKRVLQDMKKGKHYLFLGLYKNPEREKYLYYSVPCRIEPPAMVAIRKSDLQRFGGGAAVSLEALLKEKTLKTMIFNSVSYGAVIDALFKKYENAENLHVDYRSDKMASYPLNLLMKKRIDYYWASKGTPHIAKKKGVADQIAFIPIVEENIYQVGYITAPKNEWGKRMLKKVNRILRQLIRTEAFFQLYEPLVSENMAPELRRQFEALILEPSKQQGPGQ